MHFPSTRACTSLLAGLVAGALVTAVALTDDLPGRNMSRAGAHVVAAAGLPAGVAAAPRTATDDGYGSFRRLEAAQAAWHARTEIEAASRSSATPVLSWPAQGELTGWYGERRGRSGHVGMDIDGETGDPIVAAGAGVVEWSGPAPSGYSGYGLMVLIRHSGSVQTLYAHLSRLDVAVGDAVAAGDAVGRMGTSGHVTGSHLHFEVRVAGAPVNPANWLPSR